MTDVEKAETMEKLAAEYKTCRDRCREIEKAINEFLGIDEFS